ncbi:ribitol 5-phosphate transferase FKRP [Lampetra fluviatilis]
MRVRVCHLLLALAISLNLLFMYYFMRESGRTKAALEGRGGGRAGARSTASRGLPVRGTSDTPRGGTSRQHGERGERREGGGPGGASGPPRRPGVVVLLREFEEFENSVGETARGLLADGGPEREVLVLSDRDPYPPLALPPGARLVALSGHPERAVAEASPERLLRREAVLLVPDGVAWSGAGGAELLRRLQEELGRSSGNVRMVALPVRGDVPTRCLDLSVRVREWTAEYRAPTRADECDALTGDAVIFIRTPDLLGVSLPWARPLHTALFLQTALRGWRVRLLRDVAPLARHPLLTDAHAQWKAKQRRQARLDALHRDLDIRLVRDAAGQETWFGCSKNTARCFGSVLDDTPEYLHRGRWTPPCCLRALRATVARVVGELERAGVRYWLEGGSLLGAARHGDIIPWDYDADLGLYRDDITKCELLKRAAALGPVEDEEGFVWERAREGDFYRVHYSRTNRLHVDLWPFHSSSGTMTKLTWMQGHPQDREFPEHFLQPLERMQFAGILAYAPNNHRRFLELKFGPGVIENPEYPNPARKRLDQDSA